MSRDSRLPHKHDKILICEQFMRTAIDHFYILIHSDHNDLNESQEITVQT